MPLYEFRCPWCGLRYEELKRVGDNESYCPNCEAIKSEKLISTFAAIDDTPSAQQRTSALIAFGRDPSSRSEIRRMEQKTGRKTPDSKEGFESKRERKKFHLNDDERRDAVAMVRQKRDAAKLDAWRMEYTNNPEIVKAAEAAAKEITPNVGKI